MNQVTSILKSSMRNLLNSCSIAEVSERPCLFERSCYLKHTKKRKSGKIAFCTKSTPRPPPKKKSTSQQRKESLITEKKEWCRYDNKAQDTSNIDMSWSRRKNKECRIGHILCNTVFLAALLPHPFEKSSLSHHCFLCDLTLMGETWKEDAHACTLPVHSLVALFLRFCFMLLSFSVLVALLQSPSLSALVYSKLKINEM